MSTITTKKLGTTGLNMMEYLPTNYDPAKAYPVLLGGVGAGEIGSDATKILIHGPFSAIRSGTDLGLDLIVVVVQNVNPNPRPSEMQIYIDTIKSMYKVNAIILTGLSRSGQTAEWYVNNAENQLAQIAGLVLFSSEGTVSDMPSIPGAYTPDLFLKHGVKFWWGCGTQDSFYDANKAKYKSLAAIAPQLATWTEWAGAGHGDPVWSDGYNPAWANNTLKMSIYQWAVKIAGGVVAPPAPPPVPPVIKTITKIVLSYSDGNTQTLP